MQSKDPAQRDSGALKHPDASQWMAFLYKELSPNEKRELETHLQTCPNCAAQVSTWRTSMKSLDTWKIRRKRQSEATNFVPMLKWAAAALLALSVGFALGRRGTASGEELAALKASVAELKQVAEKRPDADTNIVAQATLAANQEMARLLTEYSRSQGEQREEDQQRINLALITLGDRVTRLDSDIQTVASDTEAGFEQTHENLTRVASLSLTANN
jgi:anti-sigma factor RsiW